MQIQTFKIFCDVAETSSFSKAAELNGVTQSAVSQQIRALEERYRVMLVERGKKNFALTVEGEVFLEASQQILEIMNGLEGRIRELRNIVAGELRVVSVYSIGLHELPVYLKEFKKRYEDVDVKVDYRRSSQVYMDVYEGRADIGLVAYPVKRKGLNVGAFWRDRLIMICPPEHRLAKKEKISLKDLQGEKFISFEPDLPTRKAIDKEFKGRKVDVKQVMEFDNIETVKRAVEIESGISIVPETTVKVECGSGSLCGIALEEELWRPLGVVTKRNRGVSPAQKQFLKLLHDGRSE